MDCSLPGSFIHGIFQARILEWAALYIRHPNVGSWPKSITGFSDKNELPLAIEVDKSHQFPLFQSSPRASLVAQLVKNLPAMRETWVPSLGWEDPLEKGKASHSSILDSSPEFQGLYSP